MVKNHVVIDHVKIAEFCNRHHIRKLALFGSVLRDDFTSESDVDVLVEFEHGYTPGFALIRLEEELAKILGHPKVDLVTEKFLNRWIRELVKAEAEVQYVQG